MRTCRRAANPESDSRPEDVDQVLEYVQLPSVYRDRGWHVTPDEVEELGEGTVRMWFHRAETTDGTRYSILAKDTLR